MSDINTIIIEGRLTRMPELRKIPGTDVPVCDLIIASNRQRKKSDGTWDKQTTYIKVTQWHEHALVASDRYATGDRVLVYGMLVDDNFELDDGKTSGRNKIDNATVKLIEKAHPKNTTLD